MQFVRPMPFQEAIDKIGNKTPIGSALNSEQWFDVPLALRERAFFSSTIESVRFLQRGRDMIADFLSGALETLPDGTTALAAGSRAEFVKRISAFALAEGMGPLDPELKGGLQDITSQQRLNLIFDVQQESAQSYGYWKQGMDPDVLDEFPAQRFIREVEVKTPRIIHQENTGVVQLKTDLEWWCGMNSPDIGGFGVPWGPWGFNSGMGVEDVDRAEAEPLGLLDPGETVQPVEKDFNDKLQASTMGLDDDMIAKLQEAFGDQIDISGDAAAWVAAPPAPVPVPAPAPAPVPAIVPPVAAPVPAPTPAPIPVAAPQRQSPVSDAITIKVRNSYLRRQVQAALDAIDTSHDDGKLPALNVDGRPSGSSLGTYYRGGHGISVRGSGDHPALTMVHEVGHFLDEMGIGSRGFASISDPLLKDWRDAVQASQAVIGLNGQLAAAGTGGGKFLRYLLSPQELFARSYAQYIAEASRDKTLLKQLAGINGQPIPERQWSTADFAPIRAAFDKLFKTLGWL